MREERLRQLVRIVREQRSVDLDTLQRKLNISYPTLRRDLEFLAKRGVLQRVRGGAVAPEGLDVHPNWFRTRPRRDLKVRIGEAAARLVKPQQTIMLENGSTTLEVASALLRIPDITVITNSLEIGYLLKANGRCREVTLTGGTLRYDTDLIGPLTIGTIRQFRADIAFVGAIGLSTSCGITDTDLGAAEIKRAFMQSAQHVVLVADHTKIGTEQHVVAAPLSAVHTMVTTSEAPAEAIEDISALGVRVILC